ncbi:alpha/beta fold hydrolase, partial [Brevundimonas diminuta]
MRHSLRFALVPAVAAGALMSVSVGAAPVQAASPAAAPAAAPFQSSRILVETKGHGPDVVLIPGLASTSAVWARTAAALEGRYRVHLVTVR